MIQNGVPTSKITVSPHGLVTAAVKSGPVVDAEQVPLRRIFWKVRLRQGRRHVDKGSQSGAGIKNRAPPVRSDPEWRGSRILRNSKPWPRETRGYAFLRPFLMRALYPCYQVTISSGTVALDGDGAPRNSGIICRGYAGYRLNLGGIAEWVRHGENGLLVDFDDVLSWRDAFRRCAENGEVLVSLRRGVRPPRGMQH